MPPHPISYPCHDCTHGACIPTTVKYQNSSLNYGGCVAKLLELAGFITDGQFHCSCYRENPEKHDAKFYKSAALKVSPVMNNKVEGTLDVCLNDKAIIDESEHLIV
jgi:hypothetical protein